MLRYIIIPLLAFLYIKCTIEAIKIIRGKGKDTYCGVVGIFFNTILILCLIVLFGSIVFDYIFDFITKYW